jgi:hypothetical protein
MILVQHRNTPTSHPCPFGQSIRDDEERTHSHMAPHHRTHNFLRHIMNSSANRGSALLLVSEITAHFICIFARVGHIQVVGRTKR